MEKPFTAYSGNEPYLCVCYAHGDAEIVYPEIDWLHRQGINVWYDEGIEPGAEFPERIANAFLGASLVLFYVSQLSVERRYCRDEIYFARDNDKIIIASYLTPAEFPPGLALATGAIQAVMRYEMQKERYQKKLLDSLRSILAHKHETNTATKAEHPNALSNPPFNSKTQHKKSNTIRYLVLGLVSTLLGLGYITRHYLDSNEAIDHARSKLLPAIEQQIDNGWRDFTKTYALALEAERVLPNDTRLKHIFDEISLQININSEPQGAVVRIKPYAEADSDWQTLGITPISNVRVPIGIFRWQLEKKGYEPIEAAASSWDINFVQSGQIVASDFFRKLDPKETIPEGMVRVQGRQTPEGQINDFFIDKYEITNAQYQEFVNQGAYSKQKYWKHRFIDEGQIISWQEAMDRFVDQSNRPGPSTWLGGAYPEGLEDHPVSGVSWYEAAAYAEFVGKSLPTGSHWGLARGEYSPLIAFPQLGGYAVFAPFSNMENDKTVAVGSLEGVGVFGAYDLAGNVREWCWNSTAAGKLVRGGAFYDNSYRFGEAGQAPGLFREAGYGFRTALYPDGIDKSQLVFATTAIKTHKNLSAIEAVSDDVFDSYKRQFNYDPKPLDKRLESVKDSSKHWRLERVSVSVPYSNERMIVNLFLPKNSAPPYQTVVYFHGSAAQSQTSSVDLDEYMEFPIFLSFLLRSGRAVAYPTYQGTFERERDPRYFSILENPSSHDFSRLAIEVTKDFKRTIDYLETRNDIDLQRLAYYGMSQGGAMSAIVPAVEPRIAITISLAGGFVTDALPEVNPGNYLPRIKTPFLRLIGKYDSMRGYEFASKHMFDILGTKDADKRLVVYETDHIPPKKEYIAEILAWLDKYFGKVKPL